MVFKTLFISIVFVVLNCPTHSRVAWSLVNPRYWCGRARTFPCKSAPPKRCVLWRGKQRRRSCGVRTRNRPTNGPSLTAARLPATRRGLPRNFVPDFLFFFFCKRSVFYVCLMCVRHIYLVSLSVFVSSTWNTRIFTWFTVIAFLPLSFFSICVSISFPCNRPRMTREFSKATDIWMLGQMLWSMCTGEDIPFPDMVPFVYFQRLMLVVFLLFWHEEFLSKNICQRFLIILLSN